jgi:predicted nucleotidyltransferase
MLNQVDDFVAECVKRFDGRINGILYYGSTARNAQSPFSDQDLLITGGKYDFALMEELRHLIKSVTFFIDLPVVFESELSRNPDDFRLINHGCYFLEILKQGRALHGRNIFLDIPRPSEMAIRQSLFDTLTEYAQFFRRNFVESNRERSLAVNYQLNRRLIKAVHDLVWLVSGQFEQGESAPFLLDRLLPTLMTDAERLLVIQLADPKQAEGLSANLSDSLTETRFAIMEKIYQTAQSLLNPPLQ